MASNFIWLRNSASDRALVGRVEQRALEIVAAVEQQHVLAFELLASCGDRRDQPGRAADAFALGLLVGRAGQFVFVVAFDAAVPVVDVQDVQCVVGKGCAGRQAKRRCGQGGNGGESSSSSSPGMADQRRLTPLLDWGITASFGPCSHRVPADASGNAAELRAKPGAVQRKDGGTGRRKGRRPVAASDQLRSCWFRLRRVSTKCWPAELVQLSWLVETSRQLKLIVRLADQRGAVDLAPMWRRSWCSCRRPASGRCRWRTVCEGAAGEGRQAGARRRRSSAFDAFRRRRHRRSPVGRPLVVQAGKAGRWPAAIAAMPKAVCAQSSWSKILSSVRIEPAIARFPGDCKAVRACSAGA